MSPYDVEDDSDKESFQSEDSGGEEETSVAVYQEQQVSVEEQLDRVRKQMTIEKIQWKDISEDDKKRLLGKTTSSSQPTALHIIAEEKCFSKDEAVLQGIKDLVEYLVKNDKDSLLRVKEESGYTPLHTAIQSRNRRVVKWICAAYGNIDEVLRLRGAKLKRNCIHLAIECAKSGNDSTARNLVAYASADTLVAKDERGNTPLHLAVEYNKCLDGQIELVQAILEKSDCLTQSDSRADHDFNNTENSPYRHHLDTAKAAAAAAAAEEAKNPQHTHTEPPDMEVQRAKRAETAPRQPAATHRANITAIKEPLFYSKPGDSGDKAGLGLRSRDKPQMRQPDQLLDSGFGAIPQTIKNVRHAEEIREFLKKHYLRSRGQEDALKILYGNDPTLEKAIYFDLSEYKSLTTGDIGQHLSILEFEDLLQYVDIPKISRSEQVVNPKTRVSRARIAAQQGGDGRTDVPIVFEQLRKKGVKTVLEVIVEDLEHPAHSDSAIEEALLGQNGEQNMNIEIWNWKKVDISPDLIFKVASGVTYLQLYWSGQNAVLRAWSEDDGLSKLTKLKHLALHVQDGYLDPLNRIQENINTFRERLLRRIARVRAGELVKDLQEYVQEQANSSKKLKEGLRERLVETSKSFKELLQTTLVESIFHACNAKIKTQTHNSEDMKRALGRAKDKIKKFFTSERRKEMNSNIITAATLLKEFSEARLRAKTWAKEIADEMASAHGDFNFECFFPAGQHRMYNNASQTPHGYLDEPQNHEWIQCMTGFRQLLYNAEKSFCRDPENAEVLKRAVAETGGPITVALIDDGIEVTEIHFDKDMQLTGKSFFPKPPKKNSSKSTFFPWYYSERGHGTIMASQIHRIAPKANLCVLKLQDNYYAQTNKRNITMRSATEAILEAIRRKVHIISMSWTITPPSNESETEQKDRKDLEAAITKASAANILMFCSASDEGAKQLDTLPSKASGGIFKIGGADANGGLYERVGDIAAVDYTLPGHLVASDALADSARSKVQYSSGSSVATALAAGLAALILYCAQIRIARALDDEAKDTAKKHFKLLREHAKMKEVFNNLRSQNTTGKNLAVWKTFGKKVEDSANIRNPDPNKLIDLVASTAGSLCHQF